MEKIRRILLSTGGTGGHIFPAIALANAIKEKYPQAKIVFVGGKNRMEEEKITAAGFNFTGLPIRGLERSLSFEAFFKNLSLPFLLIFCWFQAIILLFKHQPQIVVGFGGYASFPALSAAQTCGVPTVLQEQNSFAGLSNRILSFGAKKIAVAFDQMDRFFSAKKIVLTGNPVRKTVTDLSHKKEKALEKWQLNPDLPTLLVLGGSQGARAINQAMRMLLPEFETLNLQILWQCGKHFYPQAQEEIPHHPKIKVVDFISEMDEAYALATWIVSRAGALSLAELACVGKPTILVPFPYAAADHQRKNAQLLMEKKAALMLEDQQLNTELFPLLKRLMEDENLQKELAENLKKTAIPDASNRLLQLLEDLCK